jgi:hypothetical protein
LFGRNLVDKIDVVVPDREGGILGHTSVSERFEHKEQKEISYKRSHTEIKFL